MKKFQSFGVIFLLFTFEFLLLTSCSVSTKISKSAKNTVLNAAPLKTAHIGISIYDPETGKYLYNYQGDKYFVPASNTKIPTCYAAMKYLGDSLVGLRYGYSEDQDVKSVLLGIQPTGDPTFLHSDFKNQPVWNFLEKKSITFSNSIGLLDTVWRDERWGSGWSWTDYDAAYMAERNVWPVFGNVIDIKLNKNRKTDSSNYFITQDQYLDKIVNRNNYLLSGYINSEGKLKVQFRRALSDNQFLFDKSLQEFSAASIPFVTSDGEKYFNNSYLFTTGFLYAKLRYRFGQLRSRAGDSKYAYNSPDGRTVLVNIKKWNIIHSQPTDSLLKPMMHRSDNFFAEQSLLMVSNEHLGYMNDAKIIDTLLKTDFKDLLQKPRWADGSGLSRYNLFTPQDFVAILNKMKNEFGMERIKTIFPSGGEGTISSYYKAGSGYIYAKTGTLSGVVALSGFLYTKKGKLLIFSTLVNNHQATSTEVRRAVERFIESVRENY